MNTHTTEKGREKLMTSRPQHKKPGRSRFNSETSGVGEEPQSKKGQLELRGQATIDGASFHEGTKREVGEGWTIDPTERGWATKLLSAAQRGVRESINLTEAGLRNLGSAESTAPRKFGSKSMFRRKSGTSRR